MSSKVGSFFWCDFVLFWSWNVVGFSVDIQTKMNVHKMFLRCLRRQMNIIKSNNSLVHKNNLKRNSYSDSLGSLSLCTLSKNTWMKLSRSGLDCSWKNPSAWTNSCMMTLATKQLFARDNSWMRPILPMKLKHLQKETKQQFRKSLLKLLLKTWN